MVHNAHIDNLAEKQGIYDADHGIYHDENKKDGEHLPVRAHVAPYAPAASGNGTISYFKFSGSAIAPLAGVLSADNATFYAGTSGDNLVHLFTRSAPTTFTDSSTLAPNLTNPSGAVVPVNLIVQKPRRTT